MNPGQFQRQLEQNVIAPVYLFQGDPGLLQDEAWAHLRQKLVPRAASRFNGERLQARACTAAQVLDRLRSAPMFGSKRLLMVEQIEDWAKDQRQAMQSFLSDPHPTSCLVLTAVKKKGIEAIEAAVARIGQIVSFSPPNEREAPRWLQLRAKIYGKRLDLQTAALIVEQVGVDLNQLDQELAKLASYTAEREIIEAVDVDQSIDSRRSYSTFDLLRQVGRHKPATALKILKRLILVGEAPLAILGSLSWQVRILWQIKDGILRGQSKEDIGRALSLRPHLFHGYWQEAQQATLAGLRRLHDALRQSDLTLKSTGISPELVLELLLLELCCVKRSGHGVEHLAAGRRSRQPS